MKNLNYKIGNGLSINEINSEVDLIWNELKREESPLRKEAKKLGIDITSIISKKREEIIDLKRDGMGLDSATTAIIVTFSPVAAKIVKDLWDNLFLPKIKQSMGVDALKEEKNNLMN